MSGDADRAARHERARDVWSEVNAAFADADGRRRWAEGLTWGLFGWPEAVLGALGPVAGLDVVELACGTAPVSAHVVRHGGRAVALDLSREQLATAQGCALAHGATVGLVEASADALPLASGRLDVVVSEYGAAPWCDPELWVPEAARVLRPDGRLVFLTHSPLVAMCVPDDGGVAADRLLRGPDRLRRVTWPGGGTEFHPSHGEWIAHLVAAGFTVEALVELHPPPGAADHEWYEIVTTDWARTWPAEDLWMARRT